MLLFEDLSKQIDFNVLSRQTLLFYIYNYYFCFFYNSYFYFAQFYFFCFYAYSSLLTLSILYFYCCNAFNAFFYYSSSSSRAGVSHISHFATFGLLIYVQAMHSQFFVFAFLGFYFDSRTMVSMTNEIYAFFV